MSSGILPSAIPSMAIGAVSLALGLISLGGDLQSQRDYARAASQFEQIEQQRVQQEIAKIEADKAIATAAKKNGVTAPKQLILSDYTKNPRRPEQEWKTIVNPNDCVEIYDRFRTRIGTAYGGVYYPIENAKNLCDEVKK